MSAHITCQDVLDALYELIDCEECDRRSGLIDAGSVPGPDARARALMIQPRRHLPATALTRWTLNATCALSCAAATSPSRPHPRCAPASLPRFQACPSPGAERVIAGLTRLDEAWAGRRFSVTFVAAGALCLGGWG